MSNVTEPERGPLTLAQIHWLQGWAGGVVDHDPFAARMLERALDELETARRDANPNPSHKEGPGTEGWTERVQSEGFRPHDAPGWADRWEKDADGVCRWRGWAHSLAFAEPGNANPLAPAYAYARDILPNMKCVTIYLGDS